MREMFCFKLVRPVESISRLLFTTYVKRVHTLYNSILTLKLNVVTESGLLSFSYLLVIYIENGGSSSEGNDVAVVSKSVGYLGSGQGIGYNWEKSPSWHRSSEGSRPYPFEGKSG
jgi:hypothetical protein